MATNRPNKRRRQRAKQITQTVTQTVTLNGASRAKGERGEPNRRAGVKTAPRTADLGSKSARFIDPAGGGFAAKVTGRPAASDLPWEVVNARGAVLSSHPTKRHATAALDVLRAAMRAKHGVTPQAFEVRRRRGNV